MRSTIVPFPGILAIAVLMSGAAQAKQPPALYEVSICLRNTVVSTPGAIERAKALAVAMFASVGVNIHWRTPNSEPPDGISVDVLLSGDYHQEDTSGPLAEAYPFAG